MAPLHVPGLKPDSQAIKPGRWYLLRAENPLLRDVGRQRQRLEVTLVVDEGEFKGERLSDAFYLTSKRAKQRLWHFLSRAGYTKELLEAEIVDEKKIVGLRLWAFVVEDDYGSPGIPTLKTEWKFRSVAEGKPEEEEGVGVVDYGEEEPETDGLSEAL